MSRMYSVVFSAVSVAAAQDLFELTPADDKPIAIHAIYLSNVGGTADAGDAAEEFLRADIIRGFTTSGSGGTAPTAGALDPADAAAGCTAEVNNTTVATTGTTVTLHSDGFNSRVGWVYVPTPECRPKASQANTTIVVRLTTAPADAILFSGTLYFEEL